MNVVFNGFPVTNTVWGYILTPPPPNRLASALRASQSISTEMLWKVGAETLDANE